MARHFGILLVFLLLRCTSETEEPLNETSFGYAYYPLEVGQSKVYRVDSIQFDIGVGNLPVFDSSTFYLREHVVEIIDDLEGNDLYRIERSRSESLDGPWFPVDVMTRQRTTSQAYSTENNIKLINLVFPLRKDLGWNGTAYLNDKIIVFVRGESLEMYKGWDFKILEEGISEQVGDLLFDEIATIQQADSENTFEKRYSLEKYAKGVGLVYRERQIVDSYCKYKGDNAQCVGLEWQEKAGRGFFTRETLVLYN